MSFVSASFNLAQFGSGFGGSRLSGAAPGPTGDRRQGLGECAAVSHGLDFRQPVEPGDEGLGQLAILEALVELLTDGQGEPGDFAVARHRGPLERGIVFMRGNDNRNASRVKSYGRILNGFCAWLRNGDFIENRGERSGN